MIVQFRDVVKRYGQHLVLDHENFDIQKGEIIGLLGPNGAGKTTTIKALLGLIPVNSGDITLFGESLKGSQSESAWSRRKLSSLMISQPGKISIFSEDFTD